MKKEMNGKSRRKWVVGGAMVFGSIALLSTGFATWVIGAVQDSYDGAVKVGLDVVKNESITVTGKMTEDAILIADEDYAGTLINVVDGTSKRDLEVTVELTAVHSAEYKPGDVDVKFLDNCNRITKTTVDGLHSNLTSSVDWSASRSTTNDYYSIFNDTITVKSAGSWAETDNGNGTFTSVRTISYEFAIGDIWGSDLSFAKFIDKVYNGKTASTELYGEIETEMEEEIAAIETALKDAKINLKVNKKANA